MDAVSMNNRLSWYTFYHINITSTLQLIHKKENEWEKAKGNENKGQILDFWPQMINVITLLITIVIQYIKNPPLTYMLYYITPKLKQIEITH